MRGKLRDKRAVTKRDIVKREVIERRRPTKRDTRTTSWINQQVNDDEYESYIDDDEEIELEQPTQKK
ncbi:MAG TPA: hypothetical protein VKR06_26710 [Ktedonosporobacter sp.]|nr:hypothetical protein [Ktedonosporobacter sp.]